MISTRESISARWSQTGWVCSIVRSSMSSADPVTDRRVGEREKLDRKEAGEKGVPGDEVRTQQEVQEVLKIK